VLRAALCAAPAPGQVGFAKDMLFTGRKVGAAEMAANGAVQQVVPAGEAYAAALATAR